MITFIKLQAKADSSIQAYIFSRYQNTLEKGFALRKSVHFTEAITSHFYHFASFLADLEDKFILHLEECMIEEILPNDRAKLVFLDPPSLNISLSLIHKFKKSNRTMLIAENPHFLEDACIEKICPLFNVVISSMPLGFKNLILSESSFAYKEIPSYPDSGDNVSRKLTTLIYSNLFLRSSSNYPFRIKLINLLTELYEENFDFYGRNWQLMSSINETVKKTKGKKRSRFKAAVKLLIRFLNLNLFYPKTKLTRYQGSCLTKSILSEYKTFIAIENSCSVPGFFTEKALEPLIYGCLPIMITDNHTIPPLFNDIPRFSKQNIPSLLSFLTFINSDQDFLYTSVSKIKSRINKRLNRDFEKMTSLGILKCILRRN